MVLKYCPRHQDLLPLDQFGLNNSSKDGYMWVCRACENRSAILRYSRRKLGLPAPLRRRSIRGVFLPAETA